MKTCKHTHRVCRDVHYCHTLSRRRVRCFHVCVLISWWLKCVSVSAVWTQMDVSHVCHSERCPAVFRGVCVNFVITSLNISIQNARIILVNIYCVNLLILFCFHSDRRWVIYTYECKRDWIIVINLLIMFTIKWLNLSIYKKRNSSQRKTVWKHKNFYCCKWQRQSNLPNGSLDWWLQLFTLQEVLSGSVWLCGSRGNPEVLFRRSGSWWTVAGSCDSFLHSERVGTQTTAASLLDDLARTHNTCWTH